MRYDNGRVDCLFCGVSFCAHDDAKKLWREHVAKAHPQEISTVEQHFFQDVEQLFVRWGPEWARETLKERLKYRGNRIL